MIKIQVQYDGNYPDKNIIQSLIADGHAGSGPYGHDLACAAVSAVLVGGINALKENQDKYDIIVKEGHIEINLKAQEECEEANSTLFVVLTQLETIAKSYPNLIKISDKN